MCLLRKVTTSTPDTLLVGFSVWISPKETLMDRHWNTDSCADRREQECTPLMQRETMLIPGRQKASPSRGRRLGVLHNQATESRSPATKVIPALLTVPRVGRYAYSPQQAAEVCNRLSIRAFAGTSLIKGAQNTSQHMDTTAVL